MGRFRSSKSQALHAVNQKLAIGKSRHHRGDDCKIHSLGTARTYIDSLKCLADYISENKLDPKGKGLTGLTKEIALAYLEDRSQFVGQKQLDKDRQAIQFDLVEKLPFFVSGIETVLKSRAYTSEQMMLISSAQSKKYSLSTLIAADAGLRAHELLTLMRSDESTPSDHRAWTDELFLGREDVVLYTTRGKGGLVRHVAINSLLASQLEELRLEIPRVITDRKIFYNQFYDLGGGKQWTDSFTKASQRALGWTSGAHGVRHTYAQRRMIELQNLGLNYERALGIISQEMGHFRPQITEVYLR